MRKTGRELWTTKVADQKLQYSMTVAPLVVKDKVIVGPAGGEYGIRGFLAAFDANTGKEVWRFYTIPAPGEPGHDTWHDKDGKPNDSWLHGGAPIWVTGSYDPETNLTFWGTGNPGPDYNGDNRMGDNLYSSSVFAIDADTGKLKWYYQFSPHDEFDWDSTQTPVLADINFRGTPRKSCYGRTGTACSTFSTARTVNSCRASPLSRQTGFPGSTKKGKPIRTPGIAPTREGTLVFPGQSGRHQLVSAIV
jgi:alcohol dehydrogenase (cytochrome c)